MFFTFQERGQHADISAPSDLLSLDNILVETGKFQKISNMDVLTN